jgi:hypothetical protein
MHSNRADRQAFSEHKIVGLQIELVLKPRKERGGWLTARAAAACCNERTFVLELLVLGGGILVL